MKQKIFKHCIILMTSSVVASINRIKSSAKQRKGERGEDQFEIVGLVSNDPKGLFGGWSGISLRTCVMQLASIWN